LRDLERVLSSGIAHKVIFGTDWPVFREFGSLKDSVIAAVEGENALADLSSAQLALVLSGNIERILAQAAASSLPHAAVVHGKQSANP